MTDKQRIAQLILSMPYGELEEIARDLEQMQRDAKTDGGFTWKANKAYGEYGLMCMLHCWAEGVDQDE